MKLAINGSMGRMGRMILTAAASSREVSTVVLIDPTGNRVLRTPFGEQMVHTDIRTVHQEINVGLDFSSEQGAVAFVEAMAEKNVPVVSGTTGLSEESLKRLKKAAEKTAILWTPNTSLAIYSLHQAAAHIAAILGTAYDCEIVEAHHRHKKDAPSGTALSLAAHLEPVYGPVVLDRTDHPAPRQPQSIGISSVRGGEVVGEHTVYFLGEFDRIEITHRANNRMVFAQGALELAKKMIGRCPGWYTMPQILASH